MPSQSPLVSSTTGCAPAPMLIGTNSFSVGSSPLHHRS